VQRKRKLCDGKIENTKMPNAERRMRDDQLPISNDSRRRAHSYSGERFTAIYHLTGREAGPRAKAQDLCLEQTVELPDALVKDQTIRAHVLGQIESLSPIGEDLFEARISFAIEIVGGELTQLVNVLFGNISIKSGVRLERMELPPSLLQHFRGPRFGIFARVRAPSFMYCVETNGHVGGRTRGIGVPTRARRN
jgi:hypothetical protein